MTTDLPRNNMPLPPPDPLEISLLDGNRVVGWVKDHAVGFRGFADETEAAHAAWVAHGTVARRLERRHGGPPAPVDVEPLSLAHDGDRAVILAAGQPVATLVPPGADSLSGPDSFGFEIEVPPPVTGELALRSLAHRMYRRLRRSGVPWARWDGRSVRDPLRVAARTEPV